jgi:hypothetical protein
MYQADKMNVVWNTKRKVTKKKKEIKENRNLDLKHWMVKR